MGKGRPPIPCSAGNTVFALLCSAILACACKGEPSRASEPGPSTPRTNAAPPGSAPNSEAGSREGSQKPTGASTVHPAHRCTRDLDCMNSCSQGAVNIAWYRQAFPGGEACEGGCTSKSMAAPLCRAGICSARDSAASLVRECTQKPPAVNGSGPAHRCSTASDCMNTCKYGAVNRKWYELELRPRCKDGCVGQGTRDAQCEQGTCVAYRKHPQTGKVERDPNCTERSIWE